MRNYNKINTIIIQLICIFWYHIIYYIDFVLKKIAVKFDFILILYLYTSFISSNTYYISNLFLTVPCISPREISTRGSGILIVYFIKDILRNWLKNTNKRSKQWNWKVLHLEYKYVYIFKIIPINVVYRN